MCISYRASKNSALIWLLIRDYDIRTTSIRNSLHAAINYRAIYGKLKHKHMRREPRNCRY